MPDWLKYEYATDVVEIFGIRYTSDLFRAAAFGPIGSAFRIESRGDGAVQLTRLPAPDPRDAAVELVYGLLWLAPTDASSKQGRCVLQARAALFGLLDREAKLRGVQAAMLALHAAAPTEPPADPLRSALRQIKIICIDTAATTVRHDLALEFVGGIAERALAAAEKPRTNPRTHLGIMANGLNGKEI